MSNFTSNELFLTVIDSKKTDNKGRRVAYEISVWSVTSTDGNTDYYYCVQKGSINMNRVFSQFGTTQRGKKASNEDQAVKMAYKVARERIAAL